MIKKISGVARIFLMAAGSALILLPLKVSANDPGIRVGVGFSEGTIESGKYYSFATYVQNLYAFSMKAAVALCTLMLVYAGYKYLTSKGDSGSINEAKDIIFSTLMGAALLMLVVLVGDIAGVKIDIK